MVKFRDKFRVRQLRLKGQSIWEIAQKLDLAKSSVSYWCRDIQLTKKQIQRLAEKQLSGSYKGRLISVEKKRKKRLAEIEYFKIEGIKKIGKLNMREMLLTGLGIYWGEGDKSSSNVALTSSSPKIILFMLKWFKKICEISKKDFTLRIGLNESHKHRTKKVEKFWSVLTKLPLNQFTKTTLIKTKNKKIYSNPNQYYGTLRISIRRSTCLRRKILGWIEGLITAV